MKFAEAFNYTSLTSKRYRFLSVDLDLNVVVVSISVFSLQTKSSVANCGRGILNKSSSGSCLPV